MRTLRRLSVYMFLVALAGCGSLLGPAPEKELYVLKVPSCTSQKNTGKSVLLLRTTIASKLVDSQRILFNETPDTRGFYQYASWADNVPRQLNQLLLDRLQCSGLFRWVTRGHEPILSEYALSTELLEFRHDFSTRPGEAIVQLRAELYDQRKRSLVASREFALAVPVTQFDAGGAVQSLNRATEMLLTEVLGWLVRTLPRE